jgi:hypothetical protein
MSLDLLKERFGGTISTDKKEVDKKKLNEMFNSNPMGKLESFKSQHQEDLEEKNKVIENLKSEASKLAHQVLTLEKEKSVIIEELNNSKWMENTVASNTKKMYEEKIRTMSYVDSTELIPTLIEVGRKKQGNELLNWGKWLEIAENKYLLQINELIAKKVFEDTNNLIDRNINLINEKTRGGDEPTAVVDTNYVLSFSGDRSGATDSYATTTFNPDTYSLWNGFTISFWVRPDEEMNQKSAILGTRASSPVARFHFGLSGAGTNIGVGVGGNSVTGINNPMEIGKWYNWVISYTGTQFDAGERKLRMWINTDARMANNNSTAWNNQDEATESYTHGIYFGGRNTEGSGYSSGFACALDEVAIYNKCIDSDGTFASEVYNAGTNYNHLTNNHAGNLVGYWKFNEGSGTTITDHSGNGNHGTFGAISGQTTAFPIWEEIKGY